MKIKPSSILLGTVLSLCVVTDVPAQETTSEAITHEQVAQERMQKAAQEAIYMNLLAGINTPTSAILATRTLVELGNQQKAMASPEVELRELLSKRLGELGMPKFGESVLLDQVSKKELGYIAAAVYPEVVEGTQNQLGILEKTFQYWKSPDSPLQKGGRILHDEKPKMKELLVKNIVTPMAAKAGIAPRFFERYFQ